MTRSNWKIGAVLLATAVTVGAWTGASTTRAASNGSTSSTGTASSTSAQGTPSTLGTLGTQGTLGTLGFADVVAQVTPAVVTIRTERTASPQLTGLPDGFPFGELFGDRAPRGRNAPSARERGLGSGVVVSHDGYILTNNHVVDKAERIQVELSDKRVLDGTLVGADAPSDLAVVKVNAGQLPVISLGDSAAMRVGDLVLAIGNPLGVGQTVTMGIVSAKGRATGIGDGSFEDFLQTDAPINQGNSGGALVNTSGQLIGINSQILSPSGGNIGIGFAVPSNMARNVMDQLIADGRVRRGKLGVTVQPLTGDLAAGLGLQSGSGALVSDVAPDGPAARAGVQRGDVIVGYQDHTVGDPNTLRNEIAATRPGSGVSLKVSRNGSTHELRATLDELTAAKNAAAPAERSRGAAGRFGMTLEPMTPDMAAQLNLPRDSRGVVVTDLDPSGQAAAAGLREGDVIEQVNGRAVRGAADVKSALDASADRPAVLLVEREGSTLYIPLRAPRG